MSKSLFISIFFFALLSSCANTQNQSSTGFASVDLNFSKIEESSAVINPKDRVGSYGPVMDGDQSDGNSAENTKSLGVIITPSLYKSIEAVDVLKCFEKLDQKVNLLEK